MTVTRYTILAIRTTTLGALLVGFTAVAGAQKTKPTQGGPPITTQGAIKSNPKADKGQARPNTLRLSRTNHVAPAGAIAGSTLTVGVRQELDVVALPCAGC